jgi:hypothetical protein
MPYADLEKNREYNRKYRAAHPEKTREHNRKYRAAHPNEPTTQERQVQKKAWRDSPRGQAYMRQWRANPVNRERQNARLADYLRRKWQRSGSGVHMARIQDWREFFDGLASDEERCIAAHVLMSLANVDTTALRIIRDHDFDYNYLAQHFDIDKEITTT